MNSYPEHDKLKEVSDLSQSLGEFLEWLRGTKDFTICKWDELLNEYRTVPLNINSILAEFYNINLMKLEEEKIDMLNKIRMNNITKNQI